VLVKVLIFFIKDLLESEIYVMIKKYVHFGKKKLKILNMDVNTTVFYSI